MIAAGLSTASRRTGLSMKSPAAISFIIILRSSVSLTDRSLSRERPPRASICDTRKFAKHEGLQPRASVRPLVGCSEKLGGRPLAPALALFSGFSLLLAQ